jgi:hypothetical protein
MANIHISDLTDTELQELDLVSDSEDFLQRLSEEELDLFGGGGVGFGYIDRGDSFGGAIGFSVGEFSFGIGIGVGGIGGGSPAVRVVLK